jgi:hypothetical protein
MQITIFYRRGCIKSRFLRAVLRVMDWELREADADVPQFQNELIQLKEKTGNGSAPITPAIFTPEAYSHELYCLIEYLNDRSPISLYPDQPSTRLGARTMLHRVLRSLSTVWPAYRENRDPAPLLAYYDEIEDLITGVAKNHMGLRSDSESKDTRPGYVELLLFALLIEVNDIKPIENKAILSWFNTLASRSLFLDLVAEPSSAYLPI